MAQIGQDQYPLGYAWRNPEYLDSEGVEFMEFRLTYEGFLPSSGNASRHVKYKHKIRRAFHTQLSKLWREHPCLAAKWEKFPFLPPRAKQAIRVFQERGYVKDAPTGLTTIDVLARQFDRCGYQFVPLVNERFDLVCGLDVLFLRRGIPGDLIMPGGDVDNRIKTLFDALRVPKDGSEIDGPPGANESPFFCLLQDDSLITEFKVTTDQLLKPMRPNQNESEVVLIVQVTVKATKVTLENLQLIS